MSANGSSKVILVTQNSKLQNISSNAFADIKAKISGVSIYANALAEIPVEALLSLDYYTDVDKPLNFYFDNNRITIIPSSVRQVFEKIGGIFRDFWLNNNNIQRIPAYCIPLNSTTIAKARTSINR